VANNSNNLTISDYADSHKNKQWQRYAATTAAAYAKVLLREISPYEVSKVDVSDKILAAQEIRATVQELRNAPAERSLPRDPPAPEPGYVDPYTTLIVDLWETVPNASSVRLQDSAPSQLDTSHTMFLSSEGPSNSPIQVVIDPGRTPDATNLEAIAPQVMAREFPDTLAEGELIIRNIDTESRLIALLCDEVCNFRFAEIHNPKELWPC
jgi:hypothetical protein